MTEDHVRILGLQWEKTDPFEPLPGVYPDTEWIVLSHGRSRTADSLTGVLPSARRVAAFDDVTAGPDQRFVYFVDETEPDLSWDWAHAALRLCQQVAARSGARLWIVTRTGLHGPGTRAVVRPEHDFAWALGRCYAAEHPDRWGGLVDLDVDDPDTAGRMLADLLLSGSEEDEVLLRDDGPLVARLRASQLPPAASGGGLSADRLHVISGGLLGLSFELALSLVHQGAERLLILGHSPLDPDRERNLRLLGSSCQVRYEVLDVGDPSAVRGLTERLREERIGGVFHLASQWRLDGKSCVSSLMTATREQTRVLLGAKANGALLLGELAEEVRAEAMMLFSSAAATLGSPGQAGYAAANAVLDGVARRLHRGHVRAVSIAWGPIGEVGFGATEEGAHLHEVWERLGLLRLSVDEVLAAADRALARDEPNLTVVAWAESADFLTWAGGRPVLEPLADERPQGLSLAGLDAQPDDERVGFITEVMRVHLAQVLSCAPQDVDPHMPFEQMEIDSLIALEMLFVVEREFALKLGLDELLLGMSNNLVTMAGHLDRRLREVTR